MITEIIVISMNNEIKDINITGMNNGGKDLIDEHSESVDKGFGNGHITYLKQVYNSFSSGYQYQPVAIYLV